MNFDGKGFKNLWILGIFRKNFFHVEKVQHCFKKWLQSLNINIGAENMKLAQFESSRRTPNNPILWRKSLDLKMFSYDILLLYPSWSQIIIFHCLLTFKLTKKYQNKFVCHSHTLIKIWVENFEFIFGNFSLF
jgi:hypothetical protein